MDGTDRTSRRRTADLTPKPETGLAEWTSKIKALQRQVDQDEEDETRRLEQEIAASRLARLRRSAGGASRNSSLDLSKSDIAASLKDIDSNVAVSEAKTPDDRLRNQDDTFRKLSGDPTRGNTSYSEPAVVEKRDATKAPISLAAFIGGRATGPRLTKHAPQQDAHDPTQFDQRTHITIPHPVFGRGGVAMPGMTKPSNSTVSSGGNNKVINKTTSFPERDRRTSTPPIVKAFVQRVEENHSIPTQSTGSSNYVSRQRTTSTPTGVYPQRSPRTDTFEPSSNVVTRTSPTQPSLPGPALSPDISLRSSTPQGRRTPAQVEPSRSASRSPLPRTSPGPIHASPPSSSMSTAPKSPVTTTSLSRPIQPQSRMSTGMGQLSPLQAPSPIFLKPPPSKDPTPSISRLQGRGFVQSMVRASSQLESTVSAPGSPSQSQRPEPARKATVLERWQFDGGKSSASSPPIISPKPVTMRKSHTADVSFPTGPNTNAVSPPKIVKPDYTGRSLKSASSTPSMSHAYMSSKAQSDVGTETPSRLQGLGSGNTMISYIKPVKTGDEPPTTTTPSRPASRQSRPPSRPPSAAAHSRKGSPEPEVDELGMRRPRARSIGADRRGGPVREVESHVTGGSGQPLSHLTKDRARKPRKARDSTKAAVQKKAPQQQSGLGVTGGRSIEHAVSAPPPFQGTRIHRPGTSAVAELEHRKSTVAPASTSVISERRESSRDGQTTPFVGIPKEPPVSKIAPISLPTTPPTPISSEKSPTTPVRHGRIPSTGNRATVMDVALALSEHEAQAQKPITELIDQPAAQAQPKPKIEPPTVKEENEMEESHVKPDIKSMVANWGSRNGASSPVEKRKSSYEKYSAFVLPPLAEERTPVTSPAGTLKGRDVPPLLEEPLDEFTPAPVIPEVVPDHAETHNTTGPNVADDTSNDPGVVTIEHADEPLPQVDVKHLLETSDHVFIPDPDVNTISVEVINIVGNTASVVDQEPSVFYESEVLVIIYRFKTKSSGLVATKVWSWNGSKAAVGDREERKMQELSRRYNASRTAVSQYAEPAELVYYLGGRLAIRQGTRAHWSSENTAMHIVRIVRGAIFIDELDLTVKNLCSGFAYCICLLGTVYVWYGKGSAQEERLAALEYAQSIAVSPESVLELSEGENDDDEMFWMILGERDYAQADYWQWRRSSPIRSPRIWSIDQHQPFMHDVSSDMPWNSLHDHVYVVDNVWEYFVLIGSDARGKRTETRLALEIASTLSRKTASAKPFYPSVHALVFPTLVPTDLRLSLRGIDELSLNNGELPDHMNLTSADRAVELLQRTTWPKAMLQDPQFLPIGFNPTNAKVD